MKVHHIGYLVKDIQRSTEKFQTLGFVSLGEVTYDPARNIDILFMDNQGTVIELIQSKGDDSAVGDLFKKIGVAPYHLCYVSENLEEDIQLLRKEKYVIISPPLPAPAIQGKRVAFLYQKNVGILELVEA